MAIQRKLGCAAKRFHDGRSEGQVGDKMAVHDVDVDHGAAARGCLCDLVGQVGKIRGEYGGR